MEHLPFEDLLDRYLAGSMTEPERLQFVELLNDPFYSNRLATIVEQELHEHAFEGAPDATLLSSIQTHLQARLHQQNLKPSILSVYSRRLAVAAVFLLLLTGAAYWWQTAHKKPGATAASEATLPKENILTPGGNKAILQLGDGRQIVLDSAGEGTLAQQGHVKIIKLDDGQVAYQAASSQKTTPIYNTIITPKGGQYQLQLADGSKVWLNASSSLRFPATFSGNERRVELTGEGYFEIAKNAAMPFHVQANQAKIQVLGTAFNINSYADESTIRTTLIEGSVQVTNARQTSLLKPGQQAAVNSQGQITVQDAVNVEEVVAWKNGMFQFKAASLETILRQAARWYDVSFEYNGGIADRFSGQISRNVNADQLLKILELTGRVRFDIQGKTIVVKSN